MKKNIFISILIILCIGLTQFVNAQLFGKWVLPTVYGGDIHKTYLLSFTETGIDYEVLTTSLTPPDEFCEIAAGGYNPNYDLNFYVIGDLLCNGNTSSNWINTSIYGLHPEYQIIKRPQNTNEYYSFFTHKVHHEQTDLLYNVITYNPETDEATASEAIVIRDDIYTSQYIAFSITDEQNGERYLYASTTRRSSAPAIDAGLRRWTITAAGVSDETIIIDGNNSQISEKDFDAYNLEHKIDNIGNTVIAWIHGQKNPYLGWEVDQIVVLNNGTPQIFDLDLGRIGGIEFSTFDENILYVSCTNSGIVAINYQTGNITEYLTTNGEYGRTFLQTAPDGHIYAVSNDGEYLGRINMQTGNFEANVFTIPTFGYIVSTYRIFDNQNYYILPENERQYETLSATVELTDVTCPGWTDGDATIYVSGGTPPYSIECTGPGGTIYFTWDVNQNAFYTNNLAEGIYTYTILDLYENPFPNPPPGTFEIKVDNSNFDFKDEAFEVIADYEFPNAQYPDDFYRFELGIHISNNAVLTINDSYFEFGWEGRIIIEPGSKLIVNNSTLTYYALCETKWQGIEVWGDITKHQFTINGTCYQGYLELKNNSVISFAEVGVALWGEQNQEWLKAGGIVQSNNTNFINNTKAVHFVPYENFHPYQVDMRMDNLSSFKLDTFDININNVGNNIFYKHADLFGVKGINLHGCTFTNSDVNYVSQCNLGIAAYGAGFDVKSACTQQVAPCPPQYTVTSSFNGFYQAIGAYSSLEYIHTFMVDSALFQNNITGVYVSGVDNAVIINSDFHVGYTQATDAYDDCDAVPLGYGIDIHEAMGFAVEDNEFTKNTGAPTGYYAGIRVLNCPSIHDIIYRNSFNNLSFGNYAEGLNRDDPENDEQGVEYRCNNNSNNVVDFMVTYFDEPWDAKIRDLQGNRDTASGNAFSQNTSTQWHFKNEGLEVISLYYYPGDQLQVPDLELITEYFVQRIEAPENTCPDHYGGGGHIDLTFDERQEKELEYAQNLNDYNSTLSLYQSLEDGGNTTAELMDVQTAQPDDMWVLRAQLLGDSPHLTQEVLMATSDRTDVFPDDVLFDILAANPDELKEDTLISYLENKEDPLPGYMIDILRQLAISNTTYKTILIEQMADYHAGKTQAAQDIIRSILSDSIVDINDYRNWLDNLGGLEADKQIIASYLNEGDTTSAMSLMNMIPSLYDLQGDELNCFYDYKNLVQMQLNWKLTGKNIFELDSADIAMLEIYASGNSGSARNMAGNILSYAYNYHYCDCIHINDSSYFKSWNNSITGALNKAFGPEISAEPNPASTWAAFNYRMASDKSVGYIIITDLSGNKIQQFMVTGKQGQQVWDTRLVKTGMYFYTLISNGLSKSGKIIIN